MPQRLLSLCVFVLTAPSLSAQTLSIEHQPVGCVVAEKFPRLEARLASADTVATARVVFQPESGKHWYSVAMKSEGSAFFGVIPKPKKSLKAYRYYIEVTDKALGIHRTADYTTSVVASPGGCEGRIMATGLGSASVLLQVPPGAAALPAGFASTGVVAAESGSVAAAGVATGGGGGLSTGATVGIVAAAGAAVAGVAAVALKGGEGASDVTSYTGPLSGQYTLTEISIGNVTNVCSWVRALSGTMTLVLEQSGMATGEAQSQATVNETEIGRTGPCGGGGPGGGGGGFSFRCAATGTPGNLACVDQRTTIEGTQTTTLRFAFAGALSGDVISGMVTYGRMGQGSTDGTVETHNGSTTFPVTLR